MGGLSLRRTPNGLCGLLTIDESQHIQNPRKRKERVVAAVIIILQRALPHICIPPPKGKYFPAKSFVLILTSPVFSSVFKNRSPHHSASDGASSPSPLHSAPS